LIGTIVVGIAWNVFYYYLNVQAFGKQRQEGDDDLLPEDPPSDESLYLQAFFAILLPAMLWLMCCVRAWQFHGLLQEAEEEAEARIRNEISDLVEGNSIVDNRQNDDDDPELALQDETARIT
jgi:hypothetical protein